MDGRLVAWGRAVKSRQRRGSVAGAQGHPPVLWLFTDARLADPVASVARLPAGLAGVVLRPDAALPPAHRRALAQAIARLCRARRLALSVAGDWRLAASLGAGLHLRGGRRPVGAPRWLAAATSSAHGVADLRRACRAGAFAFLSPAFATESHPGARGLGPCRWGLMAREVGGRSTRIAALGGVDGQTVRRLPGCAGVGAITALA
jgi:thiamine-phosphate pyrophosphorylase